jgi:hypothetical protein
MSTLYKEFGSFPAEEFFAQTLLKVTVKQDCQHYLTTSK